MNAPLALMEVKKPRRISSPWESQVTASSNNAFPIPNPKLNQTAVLFGGLVHLSSYFSPILTERSSRWVTPTDQFCHGRLAEYWKPWDRQG